MLTVSTCSLWLERERRLGHSTVAVAAASLSAWPPDRRDQANCETVAGRNRCLQVTPNMCSNKATSADIREEINESSNPARNTVGSDCRRCEWECHLGLDPRRSSRHPSVSLFFFFMVIRVSFSTCFRWPEQWIIADQRFGRKFDEHPIFSSPSSAKKPIANRQQQLFIRRLSSPTIQAGKFRMSSTSSR